MGLIAKALLEAGAQTTVKDKKGRLPIDVAKNAHVRLTISRYMVTKHLKHVGASATDPDDGEDGHVSVGLHGPAARVRLEGLPLALPVDLLQGHVRALLRRLRAPNPSKLEIVTDPIDTTKPLGHAIV